MFKSLKNPNIRWLGIAVFAIFLGYNAAEQHFVVYYNEMERANIALQTLAILYSTIVIGNIIAPVLAEKIGLKKSFIVSYLPYAVLVFAIPLGNILAIYTFSALIGIGAALSGVARNDFIRLIVGKEERGEATGTVESLRTLGAFLGISGMSLALRFININQAFVALGVMMLVGIVVLTLLKEPTKEGVEQTIDPGTNLYFDRRVALLLPLFVVPGIILGLIAGAIPIMVQEAHGIENVGWVMSTFHLTLAVVIYSAGKLSDIKGRTPILYLSTLSVLAGIGTLLITTNLLALVAAMVLIGIFSATTCSVNPALVIDVFGEKTKGVTASLGIAGVFLGTVPTLLLKKYLAQSTLFTIAIVAALLIILTLRIFEVRYLKRKE